MISIEDKKFLSHEGIDLRANVRAMIAYVKNRGKITQGASTITQQLSRAIFLSNEVSWERKFKEICIAIELEKKYSKTEILEFYLNNIYFANGYYGIQAASKGYFSKGVDKLDLSQIAYLCAIPNNPTLYDPLERPENTIKRRDRILYQMYKDGEIGEEEYNAATSEEIVLKHAKVGRNNYVETFVYNCATKALMEKQGFQFRNEFEDEKDRKEYQEKYDALYTQCQKSLFYEGYRIYTSIDLEKQKLLQKAVDDTLADFTKTNKEGTYSLQGAAVTIDNMTGRVVAIVGGRYQDTNGYTLNRAYQSFRQPGSAIKPLVIYTPSFERGYNPKDIVMDKAFKDGPKNSHGTYQGKITIRQAVEQSTNTVAWKLFEELTPKVGLSYLLDMGFTKIDKNDYYPAASLGGLSTGVSPVELTSGYATLENDGVYRKPTCIVKILDSQGNVVVGDNITKKRIYDGNAARMMTDVMTGVITKGTGKGLALDNMTSAGKTGTTTANKDGWFAGYTPYYTTGVWVGYDMPKTKDELSGATYPGRIWKTYMNSIHKGLENKEFEPFVDTGSHRGLPKDENTKEQTVEETKEENTVTESTEDTAEDTTDTLDDSIQSSDENNENGEDQNSDTIDPNEGLGDTLEDVPSDTNVDNTDSNPPDDDGWSEEDSWNTSEDSQNTVN
jgi:membrane peptidoglycan carboxypeptidase